MYKRQAYKKALGTAFELYSAASGNDVEISEVVDEPAEELVLYPKQYIADYKVTSSLDKQQYKEGIFGLEATIEGPSTSMTTFACLLYTSGGAACGMG